ncbi:MAG: 3-deoxy-7-phosphoheptulonate synthase [Verrucomicrobiales bacterium]|nr:3-deoxy-7-phosphoheptulonate synthase [Verrucomicrobiales bacterium]
MSIPLDDIRIDSLKQLIAPTILMEEVPVSAKAADVVSTARSEIAGILAGKDDRLLAVVGPCSIHDTDAALEYADRLAELNAKVSDDLLLVMRVYFEKPRTTVGWKGLINDPHLDESYDINEGVAIARKLLLGIAEKGISAGTEFLDTISPQFYADLISWGAIGARTTECQLHRELASGLSMPVGFKNGTGGNFQIAIDAIQSASQPHRFLSVTKSGDSAIVATKGNETCHIILRGGKTGPNFDRESVAEVRQALIGKGLDPSLMIDCSHANSGKDYKNQPGVAAEIGAQIATGDTSIRAVMIESNLHEGAQKINADRSKLEYGVSVTDSCVSWETTLEIVDQLATDVRKRRATFIA